MNEVIETIVEQLRWQGLDRLKLACLGLIAYVEIDDHTLRLHFKRQGRVVNIDISYNEGSDMYDVSVHRLDAKTFDTQSEVFGDMCFDQLGELIEEAVVIEKRLV